MAFSFFVPPTLNEVKAKIAGFAEVGKLYLDSWAVGDPGEQLYLAFAQTVQVTGIWIATITRGFTSLDTSTDPGDPDDFSPGNEALDPEPGMLSNKGLNDYYTRRIKATFASTLVTFTNASNTPYDIAPEAMTLARFGSPDVTYTNVDDPTIYVDAGGTFRLNPGVSKDLPVSALSPGNYSSASIGEISVLVSQLIGVTVTNAAPAIGNDRENPEVYRDRCRAQAAATSPNGAPDAYRYLSRANVDGTPLLLNDGSGVAVNITRVYVSQSSASGIVDVYYADDDGPAGVTDVATANENILGTVIAVPDCITFTGLAAIAVDITVTWAVKYRTKFGGKAIDGADVHAAIVAALTALFSSIPIGGFDQVAGAGVVYIELLRGTVLGAHPAIYNTTLSSPVGDTAIALGNVAVNASSGGTETAG